MLAATLCLAGVAAAGCSAQQQARQHTAAGAENRAGAPASGEKAGSGPHARKGTPQLGIDPAQLSRATRGKSIMVVGDSWAEHLAQGMSVVVARHTTVVNAGLAGCGIRLPAGRKVHAECLAWPEKWPSYLAAFRPDATILMVGYRDVEPQRMKKREEPGSLASGTHRAAFAAHLKHAVDLLTSTGKPVYLMTSPRVSKPSLRNSALAMNQVLRDIDRKRSKVGLLDVAGQLCHHNTCPKRIDGISVYDRKGQLTPKARDRIATWSLNAVFGRDED
ncbi:SGNH hydrolase domain-containing protein [Streptomyces sp. L2]|uniref:DUF459 domain-containing protein n=1 Tax=Streptomyces sp. L2 TaxID=2162665 RepID=UPI0013E980E7|nr:SGNH hydrolase domain-containing protein [Streptomyces sp. L2]